MYLGYHQNEPGRFGSGIRSLLEKDDTAVQQAVEPESAKTSEPARKVKLDYHEVLPNIDQVISESELIAEDEPVDARPQYRYLLQAGSYRAERDAESMKARLALAGFEAVVQKVDIELKGTYYRVRLGPYQSKRRLHLHKKQLAGHGVNALAIRLDDSG